MKIFTGKPLGSSPLVYREIELTNICNLSCSCCTTPGSKYPRGFISNDNVLLALSKFTPGHAVHFHLHGEPLMHPRLDAYIRWAADFSLFPCVNTNGLLLTRKKLEELDKAGLGRLDISIHVPESARAFRVAWDYVNRNDGTPKDILLYAHVLSHNREEALKWLADNGLRLEDIRKHVVFLKTRAWAEEKVRNSPRRIRFLRKNCSHIKENLVVVRWDGSISGCCLDTDNMNPVGRIVDVDIPGIDPDRYKLCEFCNTPVLPRIPPALRRFLKMILPERLILRLGSLYRAETVR